MTATRTFEDMAEIIRVWKDLLPDDPLDHFEASEDVMEVLRQLPQAENGVGFLPSDVMGVPVVEVPGDHVFKAFYASGNSKDLC